VAKISSRTRERDLDDMFSRYGRIRDILFRPDRDYAFIEFEEIATPRTPNAGSTVATWTGRESSSSLRTGPRTAPSKANASTATSTDTGPGTVHTATGPNAVIDVVKKVIANPSAATVH